MLMQTYQEKRLATGPDAARIGRAIERLDGTLEYWVLLTVEVHRTGKPGAWDTEHKIVKTEPAR